MIQAFLGVKPTINLLEAPQPQAEE